MVSVKTLLWFSRFILSVEWNAVFKNFSLWKIVTYRKVEKDGTINSYMPVVQSRHRTFSVKRLLVNILGFGGNTCFSVIFTILQTQETILSLRHIEMGYGLPVSDSEATGIKILPHVLSLFLSFCKVLEANLFILTYFSIHF